MFDNFMDFFQKNKIQFLVLWIIIFLLLFSGMKALGFSPDWEEEQMEEEVSASLDSQLTVSDPVVGEEVNVGEEVKLNIVPATFPAIDEDDPIRIEIPVINVKSDVQNPQSNDIDILDSALLSGVVHYPNSGSLEDTSNMFLFGHSSQLPVVRNQSFKAMNNLDQLLLGDKIYVYSKSKRYTYVVSSVREVSAENALVTFDTDRKMLTLSTCNNFGEKEDRFVIEAEYESSRPIIF